MHVSLNVVVYGVTWILDLNDLLGFYGASIHQRTKVET